jgi:exopolysaccharide biosynthesis polyprenyl glycosylphosphotransferase
MFMRSRLRPWIVGLHLFELSLTAGAFVLAHAVRVRLQPYFTEQIGPLADLAWLLGAAVAMTAVLLWAFRLYRFHKPERLAAELWRLAGACAAGTAGLYALIGMTKDPEINRSLLLLFGAAQFAVLGAERVVVRLVRRHYRRQGYDRRYFLIVGTGDAARALARELLAHPLSGREVIGFVQESPVPRPPSPVPDTAVLDGLPVLGDAGGFARVLEGRVVDEVCFAVPPEAMPAMAEPIRLCEERGIQTRLALSVLPRLRGRVELEQVGPVPLLTFSTVPTNEWALFAKRAVDVAVSGAFFATVGGPLFLLLAALIRATSSGPAFYAQERAGLNGRRFRLYKFRTMVADADALKAEVMDRNEMSGPVFKIKDDPRITRVGRGLRRWSLDELPQLWNVFTGDMSLVGPRPLPVGEAARLDPWQRRRQSMRPGITGLWQVSGRNTIDFPRWMELDLEYIDRWSPALDAWILLKTIPAVLSGKGAS